MGENDDEGRVLGGYNFVDENEDVTDHDGQGTHVAGTIAGGDFEGKIIPIKVTEDDGIEGNLYVLRDGEFEHIPVMGSTKKVVEGILYAAEHGDDIINMRLGTPESEGSNAIDDAIEYAASKGARIIVAAGDSEADDETGKVSPEKAKIIDDALRRAAERHILFITSGEEWPKVTLGDIVKEGARELALHAGAVVWSTMAGITGDYASLGGYQGIYQRLEMGLAQLRSK